MSKTYVQLGRMGDVLNILPLLYSDSQRGEKPRLMVAREFASLLEGVSYVEPIIYEGPHFELGKAIAQLNGSEWVSTQVNGPQDEVRKFTYEPAGLQGAVTTSFQKESWRVAGRLKEWDLLHPLVFDKRSQERENALLARFGLLRRGKHKRLMLVSLKGNSSKFPYPELLLELLTGRFGERFRILELPEAERIYDLLALYDKAYCLVSIDSAPLHLARACPKLPVIALTNDKPQFWNGSSWEPNHVFYCRYGDWLSRFQEMLTAIDRVSGIYIAYPRAMAGKSRIVHIWNAYDTHLSLQTSFGTWKQLPIAIGMCGRDSHNTLQDPKRFPYLKDCLRMGLQMASDNDVVLITRSVAFDKSFTDEHEAAFMYRILDDVYCPIIDAVYAKKRWWLERMGEIPDYVFGNDYYWSHGLWALFKKHGAVDITGAAYRIPTEKKPSNEGRHCPRVQHNRRLCEAYIAENKITSRYPKVTDQIEVFASYDGVTQHGYNPAIIEHEGKLLMAYRYHRHYTEPTELALSELDQNGKILSTRPLEILGGSIEDPKFFKESNGELCISFVDSTMPKTPFKSVVRHGIWRHETLQDFQTPMLPSNDWSTTQKNWVIWISGLDALCLYQCQPEQHIYSLLDIGTCYKSDGPKWAYGTIRGGTPPVMFDGKWLRFFHGGLDNEFGEYRRRYFMGALLMNTDPPFETVAVSKKPILYGSEIDNIKVADRPKHWKANVVFPGGVVARDNHWLVSVGINDSACAIVKVKPENLNL